MCHFYGNPFSWLCDDTLTGRNLPNLLRPHHLEVIKTLPSFQMMVDVLIKREQLTRAKTLLKDDKALIQEIEKSQESRKRSITQLLRAMFLLSSSSPEPVDKIEL